MAMAASSSVCLPHSLNSAPAPSPSSASSSGPASFAASPAGLSLPPDRFGLKSAFFNGGSSSYSLPPSTAQQQLVMRVATKGAYICRDCGYIYNERKPFQTLPDDFSCPVCAAPKRRFKPYDLPVAKNANQMDVRKARKEQLKKDVAIGNALPVGIAIGAIALVVTYLYLNSQF